MAAAVVIDVNCSMLQDPKEIEKAKAKVRPLPFFDEWLRPNIPETKGDTFPDLILKP